MSFALVVKSIKVLEEKMASNSMLALSNSPRGMLGWEEFPVKTAGPKMWSPKDAKVEPGDSAGKGRLGFGMLFVFRGLDWILLDHHVHTWLGLLSGPTSQEPVNCLLSSRLGAPCFLSEFFLLASPGTY